MRRVALALISFISGVYGHGHLIKPQTRSMRAGFAEYQMNAPVGHTDTGIVTSTPTLDSSFVCRGNDQKSPVTATLVAGETFNMQWNISPAALHVGDCSVYISYDVGLPAAEQRFFAIASIPKCKDVNRRDVGVAIPSWLPAAGNAILRWDWYALHVHPNMEFYAQCADVRIEGKNAYDGVRLPTPYFKIPGLFPPTGTVGGRFAYRYGFSPYNPCDSAALAAYPNVKCRADGSTGPELAMFEGGDVANPTLRPTAAGVQTGGVTASPTVAGLASGGVSHVVIFAVTINHFLLFGLF